MSSESNIQGPYFTHYLDHGCYRKQFLDDLYSRDEGFRNLLEAEIKKAGELENPSLYQLPERVRRMLPVPVVYNYAQQDFKIGELPDEETERHWCISVISRAWSSRY